MAEQENSEGLAARIVLEMDEDGQVTCQFDVPHKNTIYAMLGAAREVIAVKTAQAAIAQDRRQGLEVVGPDGMPDGPKMH